MFSYCIVHEGNVPQVSSPLRISGVVVGSKEIPISLAVMTPLAKRLSVTVGMGELVAGLKVSKKGIRKRGSISKRKKSTKGKVDWADTKRRKAESTTR